MDNNKNEYIYDLKACETMRNFFLDLLITSYFSRSFSVFLLMLRK